MTELETNRPTLRLFAPAKINWMLTIRGKRPDGFHDLDTIFQALNFGDELRLTPARRRECKITCNRPEVPTDGSNLIARAWHLLADRYPERATGVTCDLLKRLPAGGGLGGGSSDAAAALVGLARLWKLRLGTDALMALAAELGSDCAFFIKGGTMRGGGRGEILRPIANRLPPLWVVVVCPGIASATAAAYKKVTPADYRGGGIADRAERALGEGDLKKLQKSMINVFSDIVTRDNLDYKLAYDQIAEGCLLSPLLAGSGSSLFALAKNRAHAGTALRDLKATYPNSFVARLSRTGVRVLTT
jgi:4-diphosphocytidyl-2-C-methyl-D-erythritol kinase